MKNKNQSQWLWSLGWVENYYVHVQKRLFKLAHFVLKSMKESKITNLPYFFSFTQHYNDKTKFFFQLDFYEIFIEGTTLSML